MIDAPSGTVTLLFTDIEGSTRLLQRTGEAYADLRAEHRRLLRTAFERHDGHEVDAEGDAFFVVFGSANDAAAAAAEGQQEFAQHVWPDNNEIRVRMGLHTGEPRLIDGGYVGLDVHRAARVTAIAANCDSRYFWWPTPSCGRRSGGPATLEANESGLPLSRGKSAVITRKVAKNGRKRGPTLVKVLACC
jgi:Adenylate and Guanylate cyclase catalytic domain